MAADRGGGLILRALLMPGPVTVSLSPLLSDRTRTRADALERDIVPMGGVGGPLTLDQGAFGGIATVRLR